MNGYDRSEYAAGAVWHDSAATRADFIRNTYVHLFGAMIAFVGIEVVLFQSGAAERSDGRGDGYPE